MARTAHHFPRTRSRHTDARLPDGAWHSVVVRDLRYSARSLVASAREPGKPRPFAVRRQVDVYAFPRHQRDRSVARWSAVEERRARQRLRAQTGMLLRRVNSAGEESALDLADTVDVLPARHRRSSLWLA